MSTYERRAVVASMQNVQLLLLYRYAILPPCYASTGNDLLSSTCMLHRLNMVDMLARSVSSFLQWS